MAELSGALGEVADFCDANDIDLDDMEAATAPKSTTGAYATDREGSKPNGPTNRLSAFVRPGSMGGNGRTVRYRYGVTWVDARG